MTQRMQMGLALSTGKNICSSLMSKTMLWIRKSRGLKSLSSKTWPVSCSFTSKHGYGYLIPSGCSESCGTSSRGQTLAENTMGKCAHQSAPLLSISLLCTPLSRVHCFLEKLRNKSIENTKTKQQHERSNTFGHQGCAPHCVQC